MFFAFDVDGTLTPSRQQIDPDFELWFSKWILTVQNMGHSVLLVTGSDYSKTLEQLGSSIVSAVDYCCNCLGNSVLHKNNLIYSYDFTPPDSLIDFLNLTLSNSKYDERYGGHIEHRSSMINFSVVGRNAVGEQRTRYYEWDQMIGERLAIAEQINTLFPAVSAQAGGETGIDIISRGKDKRQVIKYMDTDKVYFFGDRLQDGGNDKPLADALHHSKLDAECISVKSWQDTWAVLQNLTAQVLQTEITVLN